ncbi:conserved hypothetical protein [Candidatus Terasakiella magnetica]|nr:conserved hypothetical protein [Candidatus Terasakiella magnetica]
MTALQVDEHVLPVTVTTPPTDPAAPLAWTVSLRTAYGPYAAEELKTLPLAGLRPPLTVVVGAIDGALRLAGLDHLVCVNNWMLSTNLLPAWGGQGAEAMTRALVHDYPGHFLAVRSLNRRHHGRVLECLHDLGWSLLPARQVWIAEPDHNPTRDQDNDARLLRKTTLGRVMGAAFSDDDWRRTADLYAQLYLHKYSRLNPVFTPRFLRWASENGFMRVEGVRQDGGPLLGVVGTIAAGAVMTTPLVGYDTAQPQRLGLYRLLTALAFEEMRRTGRSFNLSAGVGGFKRNRGACPEIEYTALWHRHLPWTRRAPVLALAALLERVGVPLMRRYDL